MNRDCNKCKLPKPLSDFFNDATKPLGKDYTCKLCRYIYDRNVKYPRKKNTEKYKAVHKLATAKSVRKYPERLEARRLARKFVPLKQNCEQCGNGGLIHRHHPDYTKPLDVICLCVPCHEKMHHGVKS